MSTKEKSDEKSVVKKWPVKLTDGIVINLTIVEIQALKDLLENILYADANL